MTRSARPSLVPSPAGVAAALTAALFAFGRRRPSPGRFGIVDAERVYRCSRRRAYGAGLLDARRIASVLNLGHPVDRRSWRVEEIKEVVGHGVDVDEARIRADRRPSRDELLAILDALESCPYPLLIHCTDGGARTSLASAIHLMAVRGVPPDLAESASCGPRVGRGAVRGEERPRGPILEYRAWLDLLDHSHSRRRFRAWLRREYRGNGGVAIGIPRSPSKSIGATK